MSAVVVGLGVELPGGGGGGGGVCNCRRWFQTLGFRNSVQTQLFGGLA